MKEENMKQPELQKELPDESMEKVSGGWILVDRGSNSYYVACQLYTDDVFLKYRNEGDNCTCPYFFRPVTVVHNCVRCMNIIFQD